MSLKRCAINFYYKIRNVKKHLQIGKSASILGRHTFFEGYNRLGNYSSFQGELGYGSYIGKFSQINATIGRYSCIADRVFTVSGTHPTKDFVSIHPAFYSTAKQAGFTYTLVDCFNEQQFNSANRKTAVHIGNDVWIGCDVTIIGGTTIGDGAIVAAGAVITQDVEPFTIVGGVPARPIRKRFRPEQIDFLLNFRWWDKSPEWLRKNCVDMRNIETFVKQHRT